MAAGEPALWPPASAHAVASVVSGSVRPHGHYSPPGSSVHGFSRQEYWTGWPDPPAGDLPDPGTEPASLMSPALAGGFFTTSTTIPELHVVVQSLSRVQLFATLWTVACQAPLSTGFSRQEHWSRLPSSSSYNSSASSPSTPAGYGSSSLKQESFVIHPNLSPSAPYG